MIVKLFLDEHRNKSISENGFIVIPFLQEDELDKLRKCHARNYPKNKPLFTFENIHMTSWLKEFDQKKNIKEELSDVFRSPLKRVFKEYKSLNEVFIIKPPSNKNTFPIHQDWSVVNEDLFPSFNIWVPLQDVNEENGALWILKGSHKFGYKWRGPGELFPNYSKIYEDIKKYINPIKMKAGEALIFFHSTIHGSPPNKTENDRIVATTTVIPQSAKFEILYNNNGVIEKHFPKDDFMLHYKDIHAEASKTPPSMSEFELVEDYYPFNGEAFKQFIEIEYGY